MAFSEPSFAYILCPPPPYSAFFIQLCEHTSGLGSISFRRLYIAIRELAGDQWVMSDAAALVRAALFREAMAMLSRGLTGEVDG